MAQRGPAERAASAGIEALAGRHQAGCDTKPNTMPEKMTQCASWRVEARLVASRRIEPGTVCAGDVAGKIGDGRDQRGTSGGALASGR